MSRPRVMGIVNVTPDSFSDGGAFLDAKAAIAHGLRLIDEGADMLDIGGESTRPGAAPVPEAVEIDRVLPVIEGLVGQGAIIAVDTMKPGVARAAVSAGAAIWNDVNALRAEGALEAAATLNCGVVLMHMLGDPRTMQNEPRYDDVLGEVSSCLLERAKAAVEAGVAAESVWIDPGIGFGKTLEHNLALLNGLPELVRLGHPVLLGASRKRLIATLAPDTGAEIPAHRLGGSVALALHGARCGVAAVRVHDVRETVQALRLWEALSA